MDQDYRRERLTSPPDPGTWVVLAEPFAPVCHNKDHAPTVGPGPGGAGLPEGSFGLAGKTWCFVPVWWLGWHGHDCQSEEGRPPWYKGRGYYVCYHQLRLPTPSEEDEIIRLLLSV